MCGVQMEINYSCLLYTSEIANNGPVIDPEAAEQIFIPFFTTKEEGSGIGLSLSKQIMRLSGGTLTLLPYKEDRQTTTFALVFS